jgi:flagellar basal body-associated protein FliL
MTMSKIICDICGTAFSDTEEFCPICGCAKDANAEALAEELMKEEVVFSAAAMEVAAPKKAPVLEDEEPDYDDFDEDEDDEIDDEDDDDDYDDDDEEDEHKSNAGLVILLVIVILLLLAVGAFILVRYFLPNVMGPQPTEPSIVETTAPVVETTELKIPCESLALTSNVEIVLEEVGANWLINVMALPENTTDALTYVSSDETVVTVNEQGKLTAVGEGTAVITITCGEQALNCTVTCRFTEETTAPSEPEETTAPEETTEPTEPETTVPETTLPDVTISFVKNDVTSRMIGEQFYLRVNPSNLDPALLTWSSENEFICKVDQTGLVTITGRGTTHVYVEYNGQKIECIVRVY